MLPGGTVRQAVKVRNPTLLEVHNSQLPMLFGGLMDWDNPDVLLPVARNAADVPHGLISAGAVALMGHGEAMKNRHTAPRACDTKLVDEQLRAAVDAVVVQPPLRVKAVNVRWCEYKRSKRGIGVREYAIGVQGTWSRAGLRQAKGGLSMCVKLH